MDIFDGEAWESCAGTAGLTASGGTHDEMYSRSVLDEDG